MTSCSQETNEAGKGRWGWTSSCIPFPTFLASFIVNCELAAAVAIYGGKLWKTFVSPANIWKTETRHKVYSVLYPTKLKRESQLFQDMEQPAQRGEGGYEMGWVPIIYGALR